MSETDSFIQEVTEEVRQDRMFRLWKKYGPYGIVAIMLVVAVAAGLNWMKHREIQAARAAGGAFLEADIASVEDQERLLGEVEGGAEGLAKMRLAAAKAESGDADGAVALYREVSGLSALGPAFTDLARLQAVRVEAATIDPGQAEAELAPLIGEDGPYRLLALELRAIILLNSGDTGGAHADLIAVITDPLAARTTRERALALLASSGGDLSSAQQ